MPTTLTIGPTVRLRRRALRLTQEQLAAVAGVSTRFIRSVEQGKQNLQVDSLLPLLDALGLVLRAELRTPEDAADSGQRS